MTTTTKQRVTLFLNPDLFKHARAQAVAEDTSLTTLVENALVQYLPDNTTICKPHIKSK